MGDNGDAATEKADAVRRPSPTPSECCTPEEKDILSTEDVARSLMEKLKNLSGESSTDDDLSSGYEGESDSSESSAFGSDSESEDLDLDSEDSDLDSEDEQTSKRVSGSKSLCSSNGEDENQEIDQKKLAMPVTENTTVSNKSMNVSETGDDNATEAETHGIDPETQSIAEIENPIDSSVPTVPENLSEKMTISPTTIPPKDEDNFYFMNKEGEFQCKLCTNNTSKTVGGIKIHISRTHKVQKSLTLAPKMFCWKCKKEIKRDKQSEAGKCVECEGMEHYKCCSINKKYILQFKDGSLPFKCGRCCIPGIEVPSLDIRSTISTTKINTGRIEKADSSSNLTKSSCSTNHPENSSKDIINNNEKLQKDNILLASELRSVMDKEAQMDMKMKLLISDNNKQYLQIQELEKQIDVFQRQERSLADEKERATETHQDTIKRCNLLVLENEKAKEVALEVQNVMVNAIREANLLSFKKDIEIQRLEKENEKWKAENATYKELLSPEATAQRSSLLTVNQSHRGILKSSEIPLADAIQNHNTEVDEDEITRITNDNTERNSQSLCDQDNIESEGNATYIGKENVRYCQI